MPKTTNHPENPKLDRELVEVWRKLDNALKRIDVLEREVVELKRNAALVLLP